MRCPQCGAETPDEEWNCVACRMNVYWASQHFEDLAGIRSNRGCPPVRRRRPSCSRCTRPPWTSAPTEAGESSTRSARSLAGMPPGHATALHGIDLEIPWNTARTIGRHDEVGVHRSVMAPPGIGCSVGIMAYNEEANIADAIGAILGQELTAGHIAELIVVASGCEDRTVPIVSDIVSAIRVRLIEQESREGKASAINLFIGAATSPRSAHGERRRAGRGRHDRRAVAPLRGSRRGNGRRPSDPGQSRDDVPGARGPSAVAPP